MSIPSAALFLTKEALDEQTYRAPPIETVEESIAVRRTEKTLAISIRLRQPTPREVQVVRLIWAGLKNRQIGERLNISVRTVEAHRSSVMLKLGVSNTAQLLRAAIQQRLV
ncbi:MAG: LuxR C-terminal-related transcriptional regulator [Nitrospiraceae bacterium]